MKNNFKRSTALALMLVLLLTFLAGCAGKDAPAAPAAPEPTTALPNPMTEVTAEELLQATGISLAAPEGAAEVRYFTVDDGEQLMAQMDFSLNEQAYTYRVLPTSELQAKDCSGIYGDSTETAAAVAYCDAVLRTGEDFAVLYWLDIVPGLNYTLSGPADADALLAVAEQVFVPAQGETDGDEVKANPYSNVQNWAFLNTEDTDKAADTFFVCPTVYMGGGGEMNWDCQDETTIASFVGATNMEKGIYDGNTRFFAPFYGQASLYAYEQDADALEAALTSSYEQVRLAFEYYLQNYNNGRPIVLAGFSQGADQCIRLMKEYFWDPQLQEQLVACYAIGWYLTEEEVAEYPQLRPAQGEDDTGVIVLFGTESPDAEPSVIHPADVHSFCINPLNWQTDATPAEAELNKGACFTDYSGAITSEIPALTGAYIETGRGVLIAPDIAPEEYPPYLSIAGSGVYHVYDYQFFYRNLQENVNTRLSAYLNR